MKVNALSILAEDAMGSGDCEALHDGLLAQPINALSSLAYLVAAGVVVYYARDLARSQRRQSWVFATLLVFVGLGSVDFHGPQSAWAQLAHDGPIALLVMYIAATLIVRKVKKQRVLPGRSRARVTAFAVTAALATTSYFIGRSEAAACNPDSVLQPHAAWHVLTATAFAVAWQIMYRPGPNASTRGRPATAREES